MEIFQFKQFSVRNERSSMKVNTDGVLLGAAMTLRPSDRLLLDIGTGTGVIALMAAQRLAEAHAGLKSGVAVAPKVEDAPAPDFKIIGIDIDYDSASEAKENFASSPWSDKLAAKHISLNDFEKECGVPRRVEAFLCDAGMELNATLCHTKCDTISNRFDVIFSNPPYFESSLKSPDERKRAARHADTLSYREIIAFASRHLVFSGQLTSDPDGNESQHSAVLPTEAGQCLAALPSEAGRLSLILPYETEREAVRYAASFNLRLFRRLRIRTTPSHPLSRVILEFTFAAPNEVISEELTIQDKVGYSATYRSLVRDFLLI